MRERASRSLKSFLVHCIQEDWQLSRYFHEYILAAFSLRMVRRVRWSLTGSLPGVPGTRNLLVPEWEALLGGHAALWLMAKTHRGNFAMLLGFRGSDALTDGPCAASFDALQATQRVLLSMTLVGGLLLGICWAVFPYWHELLRDDDARFPRSASSPHGTTRRTFPPYQRGLKVMTVSYVLGVMSMLGKNLMRPAFPGLFLTEALLFRCVYTQSGPIAIVIWSLFSFLYLNGLIALEWVGSMFAHREWDDRRWERTASGRSS